MRAPTTLGNCYCASEKLLGFQSKFRGTKRCLDPKTSNWILKQWKIFQKFSMLQAIFARILQSADKFCRIFPHKMSEFSMFYKKNWLHAWMHAFCIFYLHVQIGFSSFKSSALHQLLCLIVGFHKWWVRGLSWCAPARSNAKNNILNTPIMVNPSSLKFVLLCTVGTTFKLFSSWTRWRAAVPNIGGESKSSGSKFYSPQV